MINGKNIFDQSVRNNSIRKFTTGQGDDYTTGFFWTIIISKTIIR